MTNDEANKIVADMAAQIKALPGDAFTWALFLLRRVIEDVPDEDKRAFFWGMAVKGCQAFLDNPTPGSRH